MYLLREPFRTLEAVVIVLELLADICLGDISFRWQS
jgi:hypothetical protein